MQDINLQENLSLNQLRRDLEGRLKTAFQTRELLIDLEKGNFTVNTEKFILKVIISEEEISYTLSLKKSINNLSLGMQSAADYSPFIGDSDLEKIALTVYYELMGTIEAICNNEIYVGEAGSKSAYLAWLSNDGYMLKKYKRTFFGGLMSTEARTDKIEIQKLKLTSL